VSGWIETNFAEVGMKRYMSMDQRLREYGQWCEQGALQVTVGHSIFGRIREMQENAGLHSEGWQPDIVDGIACRPDGGMMLLMERIGAEAARDNRCREIAALVPHLPQAHRRVLTVVYLGPEPRTAREAAKVLEVSVGKFQERKAALLAWFEGALLGRAA
jgi:hypothetical protein